MQTIERDVWVLEPETSAEPAARSPRRASARDGFVAMMVCLSLWALMAAPDLLRSADAGPIGARRTVALAVLRPLVAISRTLQLTRAAESVERALDQDPKTQPGGELVLPEIVLPPEDPATPSIAPDLPPPPSASGTTGPDAATSGDEPVEEPAVPEGIRVPTRSRPLRVAVIGDSLSQGLGPAIERWMDPSLVRVLSLGRQSTGLARQDYFNWQAGMREIVERFRPDLVFVMLGSNDDQAQISREGAAIPLGTTTWVENYRDRAEQLVRTATRSGTHVVWVGIPVVRERERWDFYRRVNGIYHDVVRADPLATYVDTWSAFEARGGGYAAFIRGDRGVLLEVRAPDGIHFTPTGYAQLGRLAIRAADDRFGLAQEAALFRL